jgi:hypothetical protein
MVAGVAGGVTGAVVAKLTAFSRKVSRGVSKCGGCGNCDSENVEGVGVVCTSLRLDASVRKLKGAGRVARICRVGLTGRWGGGCKPEPVGAGGRGSLFLELKLRTFSHESTVATLDTLPPGAHGSADCDRKT